MAEQERAEGQRRFETKRERRWRTLQSRKQHLPILTGIILTAGTSIGSVLESANRIDTSNNRLNLRVTEKELTSRGVQSESKYPSIDHLFTIFRATMRKTKEASTQVSTSETRTKLRRKVIKQKKILTNEVKKTLKKVSGKKTQSRVKKREITKTRKKIMTQVKRKTTKMELSNPKWQRLK